MIYSFFDQLEMAIKFTLMGMFLSIMIDFISVFNFKKRVLNIVIQILFWALISFIVCSAMLKISKGYLPIYTFLFFLLGYFIYVVLLKKEFINSLKYLKELFLKNRKKIFQLIYPIEVSNALKKTFKFILRKIKLLINKLIKKLKHKKKDEPETGGEL